MSQSHSTDSSYVDHDDLLDSVERLAAAGETLQLGGVSTQRVADDLGFSRSTICRHIAALSAQGKLERVWGVAETGPQPTYLPVDDPEGDRDD